jgi:WD40 repeat protein
MYDKKENKSGEGMSIGVWDLDTGQETRRFQRATGLEAYLQLALSADGRYALTASIGPDAHGALASQPILLWDTETGKLIRRLAKPGSPGIFGLAFLPDGKRALSGDTSTDADMGLTLWQLETGTMVGHWKSDLALPIFAVAPDGSFAAISGQQDVKLLNLKTMQIERTLKADKAWFRCMAFSPEGHRLVFTGQDDTVRIWDMPDGNEVGSFPGPKGASAIAIAPDGKTILLGSADKTIHWLKLPD